MPRGRGRGGLKVRAASTSYAPRLCPLLEELGYPSDERQVEGRLERLLADPGARVFVAEDGGTIVGFAAMAIVHLLERDRPLCRLTSLMVAPRLRERGVGGSLLEAVESEASEMGCDRIEAPSGVGREDAHAFYARLGFEENPRRFVKDLTLAPRTLLSRARRRR